MLVVVALRAYWMPAWSLDAFCSQSHWLLWPCVLVGGQPSHWMHFCLSHIGCCGLVFLLDASLLIGFFVLITLVVAALYSWRMPASSFDAFFLITLVVVALCSC